MISIQVMNCYTEETVGLTADISFAFETPSSFDCLLHNLQSPN